MGSLGSTELIMIAITLAIFGGSIYLIVRLANRKKE